MSITDAQFTTWLKSPSEARCILVEAEVKEAGGSVVTRYLSTTGFTAAYGDTPANTHYAARIKGGVKFSESMSLTGDVSLSYGDIELSNIDGELDSWVDDYWVNRPIEILIGDIKWPREDFRLIFSGVVSGIDARKNDTLNLKLGDKLQRLNTPVSEQKLGGSTTNADRLIPLCFGECHNVEPLLVDPATLEYQVHNGPIEDVIEVRDNGVPVAITKYLSTGKFRLSTAPSGQVTASVQGDKPSTYANDVVTLVRRLVTAYGVEATRLEEGDLDDSSLDTFQAAHTQTVGVYLKDRANVLEVCNQLASSVGAKVLMTKAGLLKLVKLTLPQATAGTSITSSDITLRSLEIASLPAVKAAVKIGYCKNWVPQTNLALGVLAEHASLFSQEWLTSTVTDSVAATNYNLYVEPAQEDTLLLTGAAAVAEATRRLGIFNEQRKVLKYKGFAHLLTEELGNPQTLYHSRFGLSAGVRGQIISISTDWINRKVEVEVLI